MEFRILGPVEVWEGGRSLPLGGAKQRALLAILITQANQVVAADRLIALIWPGEPPDTAAHSLQVYVSELRKVLEPKHRAGTPYAVLMSQAPGYLIRVEGDGLDLNRFQRMVDKARQSMSNGAPEAASEEFREALGIWRGPALADLAAQPFALSVAVRLNEAKLRALEDRIDADLALGRHADLVGELDSLVGQHPLRERFSRQLMLALYRSGRQAEASDVYQHVRERLVEELGMEPGAELQQMLKAILNQDAAIDLAPKTSATSQRLHNLPKQLTSFVGRENEIEEVSALLVSSRLVTLTGAGGVGKTRLAIEVATQVADDYAGGVWLVELAPLNDGSLVPQTIMSAMGLREQPGRAAVETLIDYLVNRKALLLLDNCEHLVQAAAEAAEGLVKACPEVRVLATSRELLRASGEVGWRVPSLRAPDTGHRPPAAELRAFESVELFCDRAASALGSFTLTELNAMPVVAICNHLDGIPLAIELAAARLRLLSLEQVTDRLEDRLHLLTAGARTANPRQRTLRATIEWSYDLLDEPEQLLFERLSIFAGAFSLAAVEAIVPSSSIAADVVDLLGRLVDKSLVGVEMYDDEPAYRVLETLREFGRERLAVRGELEEMRRRHAHYYATIAEAARTALLGEAQALTVRTLLAAVDNLRAALTWAKQADPELGLKAATGLVSFWAARGLYSEGREWMELFLGAPAQPALRVIAFNAAGRLAQAQGDFAAARQKIEHAYRVAREAGDDFGAARTLNNLGTLAHDQGDLSTARRHYELSLEGMREKGTPYLIGSVLCNLGELFLSMEQGAQAIPLLEEAVALKQLARDWKGLAMARQGLARALMAEGDLEASQRVAAESLQGHHELDDPSGVALSLQVLGYLALRRGEQNQAGQSFAESLSISRDLGLKPAVAAGLEAFATLAVGQGDPKRALTLAAAATALREAMAGPLDPADRRHMEEVVETARNALSAVEADSAWSTGQVLSSDAAIGKALSVREELPAP
jgi:predicted ATPase/DNA-binding SARP family transcriptional activator